MAEKSYYCAKCRKNFVTLKHFNRTGHKPKEVYLCPHCKKTWKFEQYANKHECPELDRSALWQNRKP